MKAYTPPADGMFSKILVPTVDVVRSTWLLSTTVGAGRPCLFVGESGTAKTATIQHYLGTWTASSNIVLNMNFSSRTSSRDVQRAVEVGDSLHAHEESCRCKQAFATALRLLYGHNSLSLKGLYEDKLTLNGIWFV